MVTEVAIKPIVQYGALGLLTFVTVFDRIFIYRRLGKLLSRLENHIIRVGN